MRLQKTKSKIMSEIAHLRQLFSDAFDGNPWLDVSILKTLDGISAEKAAHKPDGLNSIWEITNHLIDWRFHVLRRISGETLPSPEDNYFRPVTETTGIAWAETKERLAKSQEKWLAFLSTMDDAALDGIHLPNGRRHFEHIHGILQHDAYHLGQIVLMARHIA